MRRVILESPYRAENREDQRKHRAYARDAMRDALARGEAPMVSHLLYTQVLDDSDAEERALGIAAGLVWGTAAAATVVYADLGLSSGMRHGIERAQQEGRPVEYRQLEAWEPHRKRANGDSG